MIKDWCKLKYFLNNIYMLLYKKNNSKYEKIKEAMKDYKKYYV